MTIAFQLAVFALIVTSSILLISVPVVFASPDGWSGNKNVVFSGINKTEEIFQSGKNGRICPGIDRTTEPARNHHKDDGSRKIEELQINVQKEFNSGNRKLNIAITRIGNPYGHPNILAEFISKYMSYFSIIHICSNEILFFPGFHTKAQSN
ncbi:hypothetical protein Csa_021516 [Cucumis sativus]|nr:hypothetical protein Csa_021516 [Cucumis sativus]